MAEEKRPTLPSFASQSSLSDTLNDPFGDRARHVNFPESSPSGYNSTVSLPQEFGGHVSVYEDEDEVEKVTEDLSMPALEDVRQAQDRLDSID